MKNACLVQQGVWDMPQESMPLAAAYLKATALSDETIRSTFNIKIFNFKGGASAKYIALRLLRDEIPDILAFSVYGWNYLNFLKVINTYKTINPRGWVIVGGPHVSYQWQRIFRECSGIDVIVNGEGEFTLCELLKANLINTDTNNLHDIKGIAFKNYDGEIINTIDRSPVICLDDIASPIISNILQLQNSKGQPCYDVAIMETQRGCPYTCAFCFLGNIKYHKVRKFSRDRLREELEIIAYNKYTNIVLCDSNFSLSRFDEEFIEDLIKIKEKYGYPKYMEASWAKNKSGTFFNIVNRMVKAEVGSSCTFAVQSFNKDALKNMCRVSVNEVEMTNCIQKLKQNEIECYGELIWGVPGESMSSFFEGYDRLSQQITQIATYPLLLLPNSTFYNNRDDYKIVAIRNKSNDFEYVGEHYTMSSEENRTMHRFLYWSRLLVENRIFRNVLEAIKLYLDITQSQVILSLDSWIDDQDEPVAIDLVKYRDELANNLDAMRITGALRYLYTRRFLIDELFIRWWNETLTPIIPSPLKVLFMELLRYDLITRPIYECNIEKLANSRSKLKEVFFNEEWHFIQSNLMFSIDIQKIVNNIVHGIKPFIKLGSVYVNILYKKGFYQYIDNHEMIKQYVGVLQNPNTFSDHKEFDC